MSRDLHCVGLSVNDCCDRDSEIAYFKDQNIEAVFTDEAREYYVEKHGVDREPFEFRLAVKRFDRQPIRSWRVLQDVKTPIAGPDLPA